MQPNTSFKVHMDLQISMLPEEGRVFYRELHFFEVKTRRPKELKRYDNDKIIKAVHHVKAFALLQWLYSNV